MRLMVSMRWNLTKIFEWEKYYNCTIIQKKGNLAESASAVRHLLQRSFKAKMRLFLVIYTWALSRICTFEPAAFGSVDQEGTLKCQMLWHERPHTDTDAEFSNALSVDSGAGVPKRPQKNNELSNALQFSLSLELLNGSVFLSFFI